METDDDDNQVTASTTARLASPPTSLISTGRVVRLNFKCRAELPIGSLLRVTGCSLWGPPALGTPADPMNAHQIAHEEQTTEAFPTNGGEDESAMDNWYRHPSGGLYASSVEMVTTPETYPIWETSKPVIVVLHPTSGAIQHHYYRYLVVTPGANAINNHDYMEEEQQDVTTTGTEMTSVPTPVMMWEHPFPEVSGPTQSSASLKSAKSITSTTANNHNDAPVSTLKELVTLPYRTLDINVETAQIVASTREDQEMDKWNNAEDRTFQAFQIRESMSKNSKQQRERKQSSSSQSSLSSTNDAMEESDAAAAVNDQQVQNILSANQMIVSSKILFICFHLPVVVVKINGEWQATWSESLLAHKEGSKIIAAYRAHWIGTVTPYPPITNEQDRNEVRAVLANLNCTPIFLKQSTRQAHYYGFCKQVLWPAFHNIDLLDLSTSGVSGRAEDAAITSDWDQSRLDHWWQAYQQVNTEFAEMVNTLVDSDSSTYLWIHDYHLSLLPRMLDKEPAKSCRKVFFLHIPFPTSQIFRELECGEEILQGMLHADVVGFHAFDHARHFLNATKRILGLNYESLVGGLIGVNFLGKTVLVSMSNVSIEPKMVDGTLLVFASWEVSQLSADFSLTHSVLFRKNK